MPLNILQGLDFSFDSWIQHEHSPEERKEFFAFYDSFFDFLLETCRKKSPDLFQILVENQLPQKKMQLTAKMIPLPAKVFDINPDLQKKLTESSFLTNFVGAQQAKAMTEDFKSSKREEDSSNRRISAENAELVESRFWRKSGHKRFNLKRISEVQLPDNWTMLRFLISDAFKVKQAKIRLAECVIWRFKEKVNTALERGPPMFWDDYNRHRILRRVGRDYKRQPIMAERFGETMAENNLSVMKLENWIGCIIYDTELLTEHLRAESRDAGRPIQKIVNIYDMENFRLWHLRGNLGFLKTLDKVLSPNYPELVDKIIVVNAPSWIAALYNRLVKKFLDPNTAEKVRIHDRIVTETRQRVPREKRSFFERMRRKKRSDKEKSSPASNPSLSPKMSISGRENGKRKQKSSPPLPQSPTMSPSFSPSPTELNVSGRRMRQQASVPATPPTPMLTPTLTPTEMRMNKGSARTPPKAHKISTPGSSFRSLFSTGKRSAYTTVKVNLFTDICDISLLPECYGGQNLYQSVYPHRVGYEPKKSENMGTPKSKSSKSSMFSKLSATFGRKATRRTDYEASGSVTSVNTEHL